MKALEFFALDKENFESYLEDTKLTDEQWVRIADDIDGRTANFLDELLEMIVQDFEEGAYDE